MSDYNDDDAIVALIAAGVIAAIGVGVFCVLTAFAGFSEGEIVTAEQLTQPSSEPDNDSHAYSNSEETYACTRHPNAEFCPAGHCLECVGTCYNCGNCLLCYGNSGGECGCCSNDDD